MPESAHDWLISAFAFFLILAGNLLLIRLKHAAPKHLIYLGDRKWRVKK